MRRSSATRRQFVRSLVRSATGACLLSAAGCSTLLTQMTEKASPTGRDLPPLRLPSQAVQLELLFVERPVNDPLLGSPLWDEMDQMAGVPAAARLSLTENGFRFGFCGSEPPPTLAALLKEVGEDAYDTQLGFYTGRRVTLRPGAATEVQASLVPRDWSVTMIEAGPEPRTYESARGVLRVDLRAAEDGWAELRITPEVHHGAERETPTPVGNGWRYAKQQRVDMLMDASFTQRLSIGELFVLSADETGADRVGNQFFRREDAGRLMQRVLVLRVAAIDRGAELAGR